MERLIEEATWGLDWVLRVRFDGGYRVGFGPHNFWSNNIAGIIAADPSSDPNDTYRVSRITTMNTGVASSTAIGWMTSIVPTPVPTPRPDRNPANTLQIAPATAARPHSTSTNGSPVT